MDINVGDIWKDKEGDQVIITGVNRSLKFLVYVVRGWKYNERIGGHIKTYTLDGKYHRFAQSPLDLVEFCGNMCIIPEPIEYIPPVKNDNCGRTVFQVGDVYRSSDNTMFLIVNIDDPVVDDDLYVVLGIMLDDKIPERYSWTLKGEYLHDFPHHPYNLKQKIKNVL